MVQLRCLRWIALSLAIGAGGRLAIAQTQQQQQPPPQQPTFRSTVDVVAVDVNVIDSTGRPVSDLTLDEFSLMVDGHPRRLRSAEFISLNRGDDKSDEHAAFTSNAGRTPGRM